MSGGQEISNNHQENIEDLNNSSLEDCESSNSGDVDEQTSVAPSFCSDGNVLGKFQLSESLQNNSLMWT